MILNYGRIAISLREHRTQNGMTQEQVSLALGVSKGTVSMIESGYIRKLEYLLWYIVQFDIPLDEVKGWYDHGYQEDLS